MNPVIENVTVGIARAGKPESAFTKTLRELGVSTLNDEGCIVGPAVVLPDDKSATNFRNAGKSAGIPVAIRKSPVEGTTEVKIYGFRMDKPLTKGGRAYA
jgi:hypothetical protein